VAKEKKPLTVDELIKLLERQPRNAFVYLEGDVISWASGVEFDESDKSVLIRRPE